MFAPVRCCFDVMFLLFASLLFSLLLGSKPKNLRIPKLGKNLCILVKEVCTPSDVNAVFILDCRVAIVLCNDLVADQKSFSN